MLPILFRSVCFATNQQISKQINVIKFYRYWQVRDRSKPLVFFAIISLEAINIKFLQFNLGKIKTIKLHFTILKRGTYIQFKYFFVSWLVWNHPNCWSERNSRKYNVINGSLPVLQVLVKAHLNLSYNIDRSQFCRK